MKIFSIRTAQSNHEIDLSLTLLPFDRTNNLYFPLPIDKMKQTTAFDLSIATLASAMPHQNQASKTCSLYKTASIFLPTWLVDPSFRFIQTKPLGGIVNGIFDILP